MKMKLAIVLGLISLLLTGCSNSDYNMFGPDLKHQCAFGIEGVYHHLHNPKYVGQENTLSWVKAANYISNARLMQQQKNYNACIRDIVAAQKLFEAEPGLVPTGS